MSTTLKSGDILTSPDHEVETRILKSNKPFKLPPNKEYQVINWHYDDLSALVMICVKDPMVRIEHFVGLIVARDALLGEPKTTRHKCHCLGENFSFNGVGCTCGGI